MKTLPHIMVAPNGARRMKSDHAALPVTVAELVSTGLACCEAGAGAMHAHVRDEQQRHVLDAGLYRELISEMSRQVPRMLVQITTEAVGRYSPAEQRQLVRDVTPEAVSISLKEMLSDGDREASEALYRWCAEADIAVQHILYSVEELQLFLSLRSEGFLPHIKPQLLFVLGRYAKDQQSDPEHLAPFVQTLERCGLSADWAVCAFGKSETLCAKRAFELGGKCRVGFENSLWNANGKLAVDNAQRVAELSAIRASVS